MRHWCFAPSGVRQSLRLARTPSFKHVGAAPLQRPHPDCAHHLTGAQQQQGVGGGYHEYYYDDATDAYWLCFIRHNLYSMHHYTGTCRMGDKSDVTTVVTPDLRWVCVGACILSQMKVDTCMHCYALVHYICNLTTARVRTVSRMSTH